MNYKEMTRLELVEGGNVFRQGSYVKLSYAPRDSAGNIVDLTGKDIAVTIWNRKGIVYESTASYDENDQVIRLLIEEALQHGKYNIEFTATSPSDTTYRQKFPSSEYEGLIEIKPSADSMDVVGVQMVTVEQLRIEQETAQQTFEAAVIPRVETVEGKQAQLEADYQAAAGALTEDSEVILARGDKPTLGARLDETAVKLAETAKKTEVRLNTDIQPINVNEMDTETKQLFTGGSVAVVGENAVGSENVKPKAINQSKVTFFKPGGKNLFNRFTASLGYYADWTTGELVASASYNASDFIPVVESTAYTINGRIRAVVYYDVNKVFISSVQSIAAGGTFTPPVGTAYIKVSIYAADNNLQTFQLEKGLAPTAYEDYYFFDETAIKSKSLDAGRVLKEGTINESTVTFFDKSTKNMINPLTLKKNYYASPSTGVISFGEALLFYLSDLLPIAAEQAYIANSRIRSIAFYDADEIFISGLPDIIEPSVSFTTPLNAVFMRVNFYHPESGFGLEKEKIQLEQGTTATTFEPYYIFTAFIPQDNSAESVWNGATADSLGDSITWQDGKVYSGTENIARGYQTHLKEKLGFAAFRNHGVSGRPMANGTANGDGTNTTGKALSYVDSHLVTIAAGTNDFKLNVPLGTQGIIGDTTFDTTTFYGAYRDLIEYIIKNKPSIRIVLFTPIQRDSPGYGVNDTNTAGHMLIDYVNAIKEIGKMYGLPVCDMYANSGFTKLTLNTFTMDGLHPNDLGYERMGGYAVGVIRDIGR